MDIEKQCALRCKGSADEEECYTDCRRFYSDVGSVRKAKSAAASYEKETAGVAIATAVIAAVAVVTLGCLYYKKRWNCSS